MRESDFMRVMLGWIIAAALLMLAGLILSACRTSPPSPMATVPVAIVAWPSPVKPSCDLARPPAPPSLLLPSIDDDRTRVYVTKRDVEDLKTWQISMLGWAEEITRCLGKVTQ